MGGVLKTEQVKEHFDNLAENYDQWIEKNAYYHKTLKTFVQRNILPGYKVLEIGCGTGEFLAATKPSRGVGIDVSSKMVSMASQRYPEYEFINASIEEFKSEEKFDYIILVDVIDHVYDVMDVFESVYKLCHPTTKIILTTINPWWEPLLKLMEKWGAKMPEGPHNFIEKRNLAKILELLNFTISYSGYMLLLPKYVPVLSYLANVVGTRIWGINKLAAVQHMILQPTPENTTDLGYGCSVVIPCYNEEGSIEDGIRRIPHMGKGTEIVVVNDGSQDGTADRVRELQKEFDNLRLIDYSPNRGKGYAVTQGFEGATQEVVMILDADLSVAPEELPRFFNPLNKGLCQFVNGSRLVYPMESEAMRAANLFGNKIFGLIVSFITGQDLSDTLCGTKAFYKKDYEHFKLGIDKWGDFDLLFGAAKIGHRIMEVPVHYKDRAAGESKMKSLNHGLHLLNACFKGFKELVFVGGK